MFHGLNHVQLMSPLQQLMCQAGPQKLVGWKHIISACSYTCSGKVCTHPRLSPPLIGLADHAKCHTSRGPIYVAVKLAQQQAAVTLIASSSIVATAAPSQQLQSKVPATVCLLCTYEPHTHCVNKEAEACRWHGQNTTSNRCQV